MTYCHAVFGWLFRTGFCRYASVPAGVWALLILMSAPGRGIDVEPALRLVESGKAVAGVVLPVAPTDTELFAAQELRDYIREASGAELSVDSEQEAPSTGALIAVGRTALLQEAATPALRLLEGEDFLMCRKGRTLFLVGGSDRGTLYSVYAFLERFLGVHWYAPGPTGEVVPTVRDVVLGAVDVLERPSFAIRGIQHSLRHRREEMGELAEWSVKNRLNFDILSYTYAYQPQLKSFYAHRGGAVRFVRAGHNYHSFYLPPLVHAQAHPEYYPLVQERRTWSHAQICLSNSEVRRLIAVKMIATFEQDEEATGVGLCQEDGSRPECRCPRCRALDPPLPDICRGDQIFVTDRLIRTANAVAGRVAGRFPEKLLYLMAYGTTSQAPRSTRTDPAIVVGYVAGCNLARTPESREKFRRWTAACDSLLANPCYELNATRFYSSTRDMAADISYMARQGACGVYSMVISDWALHGYALNLAAKLLWNAEANPQALLDEYYAAFFGRAAAEIRAFHRRFEEISFDPAAWTQLSIRSPFNFNPARHFVRYREYATEFDGYLLAARAATADPKVLARIGQIEAAWEFRKRYHDLMEAIRRWNPDPENEQAYRAAKEKWLDVTRYVRELDRQDPHAMGGDSYVRFIYNRTRPKIERFEAARAERDLLRKAHDSRPLPAVWRFLPDPEDIGVEQKWYQQAPGAHWQEIRVGEFWDTQGFDNYVGYAWYSTEFTVPAAAAGRRVALYFAGIDEQAWVYVDGMLVGEHTGDPDKLWEQPLVVDITARVKYGRAQRLVVRVHNYSMAGGLYKPVSMLTEKGAQ